MDYVLLQGDTELLPCYAYWDGRTAGPIEQVHGIMPFEALYRRTGIQFEPFNTLYQLYADKLAGRLEQATDFLMMPEYLMYRLCGVKAHEYTIATTASAVEGIPMEGDALYLSSGTWSLLGVKLDAPLTDEASRLANCSNEGGVGYIRYLRNIMGMSLVNRLREELCPGAPWDGITQDAAASRYEGIVDVNDPAFMAPRSMREAFDARLPVRPGSPADYFRCAYRSLAEGYRRAIAQIEANTGKSCPRLYIVGGGAKNRFLNRLTEQVSGKQELLETICNMYI